MQRLDDRAASFGNSSSLGDGRHRRDHFVEGLRIDLQNESATTESLDRLVDIATRNRTHATQILTQDEIGIAPSQGVFVESIQLVTSGQAFADLSVDLGRREMFGVESTDDDLAAHTSLDRKVALERDPEERIGQTEFEDDLGGGRQEGHDAHVVRVGDVPG